MTEATFAEYDLTPHGISRPTKVRWEFPIGIEPLLQIKSKSLRKFLAKAEEYLAANNITWALAPLSEEEFMQWLPYYQAKMIENGFNVIAHEAWYQEKIALNQEILGIMFSKDNQLVASGIISFIPATQSLHLNFKASDRLELAGRSNSSIGAVVDYFFLNYAYQQKCAAITSGRSRNAFGVFNNLGYLDFKLKLGYVPTPDELSPMATTVPISPEGPVLFYGVKDGKVNLYSYNASTNSLDLSQIENLNGSMIALTS